MSTQLSWLKTVTFAGFYIAQEEGYFKKEGISPRLLAGGPSIPDTVSVVTAGGADVALVDFSAIIKAHQAESDLVAIGSVFQDSPGGFVSLDKNPVKHARDLVDKKIGLSPGAENVVEAILKVNKLPVRYQRVPVGSGTTALTKGDCDVMACYVTSQPIALQEAGVHVATVTQGELGVPDYALVMAVRRAELRRNRASFVKYLRAVVQGHRRNMQDPDLGVRLTLDKYGKDLGLRKVPTRRENLVQLGLMVNSYTDAHGLCQIDPDRLSGPVYEGLRAKGLSKLPKVSDIVDTTVLEEALED